MKKKLMLIVVLTLILVFVGNQVYASGSVYQPYGYDNSTIPIRSYITGDYATQFNSSMNDWSSRSDVNFTSSSTSDNKAFASTYLYDTWYGQCSITYSGSVITEFTIRLNKAKIGQLATAEGESELAIAKSVASHELGHTIWLDDNPPGTYTSIMRYSRDRWVTVYASSQDISYVNAKY